MFFGNNIGSPVGGLSAGQSLDTLGRNGIVLSPQDQAALQQNMANAAAQSQMGQQVQMGNYAAGMGNQAANLNTQRAMALNAQQNAAQNVANQLSALQHNRATNANAIAGAMNTVAGMFR